MWPFGVLWNEIKLGVFFCSKRLSSEPWRARWRLVQAVHAALSVKAEPQSTVTIERTGPSPPLPGTVARLCPSGAFSYVVPGSRRGARRTRRPRWVPDTAAGVWKFEFGQCSSGHRAAPAACKWRHRSLKVLLIPAFAASGPSSFPWPQGTEALYIVVRRARWQKDIHGRAELEGYDAPAQQRED